MRPRPDHLSRRQLVGGMAAAGLVGLRPDWAGAEPPPETTRIRLMENPIICISPQYVAQELLKGEGFTDVQYMSYPVGWNEALPSGKVDISLVFGPPQVLQIESGTPAVVLAGSHIGCVELFARAQVRTTKDLKDKTIAVAELGGDEHIFVSMFVAHVGLDPQKHVNWAIHPFDGREQLLIDGKVDAFMTGPPFSLELRERRIGHVLVNTTTDRPWSHYFCCVIAGNRNFVRKYPVATKRAVRALLKAADICAREPERVARLIMDRRLAPRYEYVVQTMKEIPYGRWRQFDAEDTMRFYALRLRDAGMIKSGPQKILADGTDWRFLTELKKELKG